MVNRTLIRSLEDDLLEQELDSLFGDTAEEYILEHLEDANRQFDVNQIIEGKIVEINDEFVIVDVGFKSEGAIHKNEWEEGEPPPVVGDMVKVLIEEVEDQHTAPEDSRSMISLSKKKAEKIIQWEKMMSSVQEGQVVTGTVVRKIKGGLLVDIGVNVFLPASQVDIRRPNDIGDYIGRVVQCEVLKIDETRRNIVVSRRSLIEKQREEDREHLMAELEVGQVRKGIVKNIADFGAFVDLGGIDGLLHITDMSWERIGHPTEMVAIDQEIEVKILQIDREKQKIALGLKQKLNNPWTNIAEKYPVGSTIPGEVVNVMSYGAFVKLEPGIEGLVHISEMSWTRRINHPSEMVQIGDKIDVKILGVDAQGQQLSLGIKQTQSNPWDVVLEKYPENAEVSGKVRNLTNYGAFIELEEGIDGLLHVSDMSWTRKISHPPFQPSTNQVNWYVVRLRRSPTLVSSSDWKILSKVCSTSLNYPTKKLRIQKTWSRLATRSKSRSCESIAMSARSGFHANEWTGPKSKCEQKKKKKLNKPLLPSKQRNQRWNSRAVSEAKVH
jgi:small subunit ribosomal protein S1